MAASPDPQRNLQLRACGLLSTWLQEPSSRLAPDLTFAQTVPGTTWGGGIIDFSFHWTVQQTLDAMYIIMTSDNGCPQPNLASDVLQWSAQFSLWLATSFWGRSSSIRLNNIATAYYLLRVHLCMFRGDVACASRLLTHVRDVMIPGQILATGQQPFETNRADAVSYSLQNLRSFMQLAFLAGKLIELTSPFLFYFPPSFHLISI